MIQAEEGLNKINSIIDGIKKNESSDDYFADCPYKRCSGNGVIAGIAGEKVEYCQCYLDAEEGRIFGEIGLTKEEGRNYGSLEFLPPPNDPDKIELYRDALVTGRKFIDGFKPGISKSWMLPSRYNLSTLVLALGVLSEFKSKGFNVYRFQMLNFFIEVEKACEGEEKRIERDYIEEFVKKKQLKFAVIDTITNSEVTANRRIILEELIRYLYNTGVCTIFISDFSDIDIYLKYTNKVSEHGNEYLVSANTVKLIGDMLKGFYGRGF